MNFLVEAKKKLQSFYAKTYELHLGNYSQIDYEELLINDGGLDTLFLKLGKKQSANLTERLTYYRNFRSLSEKLHPLILYLESEKLKNLNVLDFGCGDERTLQYLSNKLDIADPVFKTRCLYDKYLSHELLDRENSFYNNINCIPVPQKGFDLILFIHSLHHMTMEERVENLKYCVEKLKKGGIIYIVEDSFSRSMDPMNEYDKWFIELNNEEKINVFEINDTVSNGLFYSSEFPLDDLNYSDQDQWLRFFGDCSLEVDFLMQKGFSYGRLHGVPQGYFLLRKP